MVQRIQLRLGLTLLLSVLGLASLIVPSTLAILDGQTFIEAWGNGGAFAGAFIAVRFAHILLVVIATIAMYLPSTDRQLIKIRVHSRDKRQLIPSIDSSQRWSDL